MKEPLLNALGPIVGIATVAALITLRLFGPDADLARKQTEFDNWYQDYRAEAVAQGESLAANVNQSVTDQLRQADGPGEAQAVLDHSVQTAIGSIDFEARYEGFVELNRRLGELEALKFNAKRLRLLLPTAILVPAFIAALFLLMYPSLNQASRAWGHTTTGVVLGYLILTLSGA